MKFNVSSQTWRKNILCYRILKTEHCWALKKTCLLKKATQYSIFLFSHPWKQETRSNEFWIFSKMALHSSVIPRSSQDGGWVKFPTMGIVVDVKIPPHVCLTKSNSPRLANMTILGQTIDKCIKSNKNVRNVLVGNSKFWNLGWFKIFIPWTR